MTAIGIDLGGTKIETQVFADDWTVAARQRVATPLQYADLVQAVADQIQWAQQQAGHPAPVGIGAAGRINPQTGLALTANLAATGRPFPADLEQAVQHPITYINDSHALVLSESVFGAGRGHRTVLALILGTGIGGGICVDQTLLAGPTMTGGEFGHTSAPAHLVAKHRLPVERCGCGRIGCIETYIAGSGLQNLAKHMTGQDVTPQQIAVERAGTMSGVWQLWCDLTADLIHTLTLGVDPHVIVVGGGLSRIVGVIDELTVAARAAQFGDFGTPPLVLAQGGDTSGARGAAYAAWQAGRYD